MKFTKIQRVRLNKSIGEQQRVNKKKAEELLVQNQARKDIEDQTNQKLQYLKLEMQKYAKLAEFQSRKSRDLHLLIEEIQKKIQDGNQRIRQFDSKNNNASECGDGSIYQLLKKKHRLIMDIEQTVQRHNQTLAVINLMKQQVSMARSERAICSTIFKNLQKQLSVNQQNFKNLVIQKSLAQQQQKLIMEHHRSQEVTKQQMIEKQIRGEKYIMQPILHIAQKSFNDLPEETKQQLRNQKLQEKKANNRQLAALYQEIQTKQNYLKGLKEAVGVDSLQQLLQRGSTIQIQNQKLFKQSAQIAQKIQSIKLQIQQITVNLKARKRQSQLNNSNSLSEQVPNKFDRKKKKLEDQINSQSSQFNKLLQKLVKLGIQLNLEPRLPMQRDQDIILFTQELQIKLLQLCQPMQSTPLYEGYSLLSIEQADKKIEKPLATEQEQVDIFQKVEKIKENDKILTKMQLQQLSQAQIEKSLKKKKRH